MTNLQGQELEDAMIEWEKADAEDKAWLVSRRWTCEGKWKSPDGKEFSCLSDATHKAECDLLTELGWKRISTHQLFPDFLNGVPIRYLEERKRSDDGGSVWIESDEESEPIIWCHYVHPVSGKIYFWWDAIYTARYHNNDEAAYLASCDGKLVGKTAQLQEALGDIKLTEDDVLWIKFVPHGDILNGGHCVWELDHIKSKKC